MYSLLHIYWEASKRNIYTGKLLKAIFHLLCIPHCTTSKYFFHHLFFAHCPKLFAQACLSLLTYPAQMSHSALLFVIQSMCHVSLYTSLCCSYADCFSSCSFSVYFLSMPLVIQLYWALWLMTSFLFSFSLLLQFTYDSAHFKEDYRQSQTWGQV